MTKLLGFDFGQKRTGVAIAVDDDIQPLVTLQTQSIQEDVLELVRKHQPDKLVVGIPRNLDGEDTEQTRLARDFGQRLAKLTSLDVKYQDEALSSERALERIGSNTNISERKKILDQVSAQIILEDYLK
jgi:putative Holliday junction resolvase